MSEEVWVWVTGGMVSGDREWQWGRESAVVCQLERTCSMCLCNMQWECSVPCAVLWRPHHAAVVW
jgi:hypothetical protein